MPPFCSRALQAVILAAAVACARPDRVLGLPPSRGGIFFQKYAWANLTSLSYSAGRTAQLHSEATSGTTFKQQLHMGGSATFSVSLVSASSSHSYIDLMPSLPAGDGNTTAPALPATMPAVNTTNGATTGIDSPPRADAVSPGVSAYKSISAKMKTRAQRNLMKVGLHHLKHSVQRTREKLIMRDSDVIIVTFPKSATHWLASVVKYALYPDATLDPAAAARVPANFVFHDVPAFWLLPDAWTGLDGTGEAIPNTADIPDWVYDSINALPEDTPRMFLSHMPADLFEYAPTNKTTILYMMREPHAVWHSLMKYANRLVDSVEDYVKQKRMSVVKPSRFTKNPDPGQFALDFVLGNMQLPPRLRERGPQFAWARHVRSWEDKLREMREVLGQPAHIIDFDAAAADSTAAVAKIVTAVHASAGDQWTANHPGGQAAMAREFDGMVANVVQRSEYGFIRRRLATHQGGTLDIRAMAHFEDKASSNAAGSPGWTEAFSKASPSARQTFERATARYGFIRDNEEYRASGLVLV